MTRDVAPAGVTPRAVPGVRALAPHFDVFLVDVWGVVHAGGAPFDGVVATLEALTGEGRRVLFLTNTSRTGPEVEATLVRMGIPRRAIHDVVSAGDVTRAALLADPSLPRAPRCFHLGEPGFVPWLFELGLSFTEELDAAELVVATGAVENEAALDAIRARLAPAAARGVPLVCTNPDRWIPTAGGLRLGPGAVAHAYAALGAPVFLYGKPHAPIYAEALRRVGDVGDARRVIAIGDTLGTDIRGAEDAGLASALVTEGGVHAADLRSLSVDALCAREGVSPRFLIERFVW